MSIQVGDKVKVTSGYSRQITPEDGEIAKIGRIWVTVRVGRREDRYRLDTQHDGSKNSPGARFYTLDQWAEREARGAALLYLSRDQGVEVKLGGAWHGREAELAELLQAHAHAQPTEG